MNSQPLLISVPQALSPLTSLPKISTKGQSRQSLVPPSQEYFTPRGRVGVRGQGTSKTETTQGPPPTCLAPVTCLHLGPLLIPGALSKMILPRCFGSRSTASLVIL